MYDIPFSFSSEDEIDIILHGTPEQRRHLRHIHQKEQQRKVTRQAGQLHSQDHHGDQQSSSEDEFEREMNVELEKTVLMLEKSRGESLQHLLVSVYFHTGMMVVVAFFSHDRIWGQGWMTHSPSAFFFFLNFSGGQLTHMNFTLLARSGHNGSVS